MIEVSNEKIEDELDYNNRVLANLLVSISNAPRFGKRDNKPYEFTDFYYEKKKSQKLSTEQYELMLRNQTIAMGGTVNYS
jgi:hypothetical protein